LRGVLHQPAKAHVGVPKLPFDHPERVLDLGAYLRLGLPDIALGFVQRAAHIQFFIRTAADRDLPDNLPPVMLWALLYTGVTRVGIDHVFLAVQLLVDLGNVCNIGGRADHAVH
jgi:hypothetical protein